MRWLATLGLCASCIQDPNVSCGPLTCPANAICTPAGGCATPEQLAACDGAAEQQRCTTSAFPLGICIAGVCEPIVCGDGKVIGSEVCDDGNQRSGDGCSADCLSDETCGNGYVDGIAGEQCDAGTRGLSGDGCTSLCGIEVDTWTDVSPQTPGLRRDHAMAYDAAHHQLILFGGVVNDITNDTWQWTGAGWRRLDPPTSPPGRQGAALVYDPDLNGLVLFGGADGTSTFADLWKWDGLRWTELVMPSQPPTRLRAAVTWDEAHHEGPVVFGGLPSISGGLGLGDTWTWSGTAWTQHTTGSAPASTGAAMGWDAANSRVILWETQGSKTWSWDGAAWTMLGAVGSPPPRFDTAIARRGNTLVLFGGASAGPDFGDTWTWNGSSWNSVANGPPSREQHALAYDSDRDRFVMYGGVNRGDTWERDTGFWFAETPIEHPPNNCYGAAAYEPGNGKILLVGFVDIDDTWEWDGSLWVNATPSIRPQARFQAAMTSLPDRILLYGGTTSLFADLHDTWEWRDGTWTQRTAATPDASGGASLAYDSSRGRAVLFGGEVTSGLPTSETWEWDGTDWTRRMPAHSPPARTLAAIAYDPIRKVTVLFGGFSGEYLDDTWVWDGDDWTELAPIAKPGKRNSATLAFDSTRGRLVLFGGYGALASRNDTWEWEGVSWQKLDPISLPPGRSCQAMAYDDLHGALVVYGGNTGGVNLQDTWIHRFRSQSHPPDKCLDIDTDGDGLIGCADPDCWARCTPACPPNAPCDVAAPHCGDHTCSALENHGGLCPADCP